MLSGQERPRFPITMPSNPTHLLEHMQEEPLKPVYPLESLASGLGLGRLAYQGGKTLAQQAHQRLLTNRLTNQLRSPNPTTVNFGKVDKGFLDDINKVRQLEGQPLIGTRNTRVYEGVLKKLQEKRIDNQGYTPERVAEAAYRLIHKPGTKVGRGDVKTSHRVLNPSGRASRTGEVRQHDTGFVGRGPKDDVSVKSVLKVDKKRAEKLLKGME